jgi:hypothetical protein
VSGRVRTAEEILGGAWDHAVKTRACWLWAMYGWTPADETYVDLTLYECKLDASRAKRRAEHRRLLARAAFADAYDTKEAGL